MEELESLCEFSPCEVLLFLAANGNGLGGSGPSSIRSRDKYLLSLEGPEEQDIRGSSPANIWTSSSESSESGCRLANFRDINAREVRFRPRRWVSRALR